MEGLKEKQVFQKEEALDTLDRTIGNINNCDIKATISLGFFGVLLLILFSSERTAQLITIIKVSMENVSFGEVIFYVFLIATILTFLIGIIKLFQVIFPRTDCTESDSKIYFGDISKNSAYKQYKNKLLKYSEEEYLNDITSQIHINSVICTDKFENYRMGFILALIGFIAFLVLWVIGTIVY